MFGLRIGAYGVLRYCKITERPVSSDVIETLVDNRVFVVDFDRINIILCYWILRKSIDLNVSEGIHGVSIDQRLIAQMDQMIQKRQKVVNSIVP